MEEFGTKLSRLIDEVKVALEGGEKVIVFSSWARLLQLAGEALADQKIVASSLSGPIDERKHALGTHPLRHRMLSPRSISHLADLIASLRSALSRRGSDAGRWSGGGGGGGGREAGRGS